MAPGGGGARGDSRDHAGSDRKEARLDLRLPRSDVIM